MPPGDPLRLLLLIRHNPEDTIRHRDSPEQDIPNPARRPLEAEMIVLLVLGPLLDRRVTVRRDRIAGEEHTLCQKKKIGETGEEKFDEPSLRTE